MNSLFSEILRLFFDYYFRKFDAYRYHCAFATCYFFTMEAVRADRWGSMQVLALEAMPLSMASHSRYLPVPVLTVRCYSLRMHDGGGESRPMGWNAVVGSRGHALQYGLSLWLFVSTSAHGTFSTCYLFTMEVVRAARLACMQLLPVGSKHSNPSLGACGDQPLPVHVNIRDR